jgi:predicted small lipoprotein YifL
MICYGADEQGRGGVTVFHRLPVSRLAVAAILVAALGLAACGRKGALDLPPSAAVSAPAAAPGAPALGPDGRPLPPGAAQPKRSEPFFLDWLLD